MCSFLNWRFSTSLSINVLFAAFCFCESCEKYFLIGNIAVCQHIVFQESRLPFPLRWYCDTTLFSQHKHIPLMLSYEAWRGILLASLSVIPQLYFCPSVWNVCVSPVLNLFWIIGSYFNPILFYFSLWQFSLLCWRTFFISPSMVMKLYKSSSRQFSGLTWLVPSPPFWINSTVFKIVFLIYCQLPALYG